MMNKRGMSSIVATLLLISMAIVIAVFVFSWNKNIILELSPGVNCDGVAFRAEIYFQDGNYYLDVVNLGGVGLEGFVIKSVSESEIKTEEEVVYTVEPGRTEHVGLSREYSSGNFLVVPKVAGRANGENSVLGTCEESYGYEVVAD